MIPILLLIISVSTTTLKDLQFNESAITFEQHNEFTKVRIPELEITNEVGAPELPVKPIKIALPKGAIFKSINIISAESRDLTGEYLLSCAQPPVILSQKQVGTNIQPDKNIYQSDEPYPKNIIEYKGSGIYDNQQIYEFLFYPIQYLPESRKLRFYSQVRFNVSYEGGIRVPAKNEFTKTIVMNPEDIIIKHGSQQAEYFDYVIITNPPIDTVFERFATYKTCKGIKTEVRTVNWIVANYSGEDDAAKIRNYIKTLPDSGVQYVLLGGDTDIVPCRYAYAMTCEWGWPREDSLPCDLYYVDLQGDWNFDNDGLYGEVEDSIDLYPDLTVGRAPVNTIAEAQLFYDKNYTYEITPTLDYLDNALFAADILWSYPYTDQAIHKNFIEEQSFPPYFEITKLYASDGNLSASSFRNGLNEGQEITNHDGHGWIDVLGAGSGHLDNNDIHNLTNAPMYGIFFSMGCWTAAIDYNTIGEHWLNSPNGGGISYVGNSSYGWGSPGNPGFGISDKFDTRFFYSLFNEDNFHIGEALSMSKVYFIPYSREKNVYRWHQYQLNLLGDPEMPIWTAIPETLDVSYPQTIPLNNGQILITVKDEDSNEPINDALTCLSKGSQSYDAGHTDVSGQVFLDVTPTTTGNFNLVVTAHNFLPFITTIPVVSGPYANFLGWIINDASGNSDGMANPNESILLTITIKNCGTATSNNIEVRLRSSDPYVTIQDSTESIGSLTAGDSAVVADAFAITIGSTTNGHGISFDLETTDDSQTLNFCPVILVCEPILCINEITVSVPPCMPNETESLHVDIMNAGYGFGHSSFAKLTSNDPLVSVITDSVWYGEIYPESLKLASGPFVVSIDPSCPLSYLTKLPLDIYTDDYSFCDTVDLLIGKTGFTDDMESGDGQWTTDGTNNLWHLSTRNSVSPTHSWYCGQESNGQYIANMNCYIQTDPFMIDANSTLSFYRWFDVPVYGNDGIYVIIMGNGFADTLDFLGTGGALGGGGRPIISDWFEETYSLAQYPAGETIQVRISFISDNEYGVGEGFYIDDFNVDPSTGIEEFITDEISGTMLNLFPNPFRGNINIQYTFGQGAKGIELKIYNVAGRLVRQFDDETIRQYDYISWDGTNSSGNKLPAGIYFVQLVTPEHILTRKAILLR